MEITERKNYKKTLIACYIGFMTQAIAVNFTPLLFLTFRDAYGIPLEKIALIPMVFYLAQLFVDIFAGQYAEKIGYRICIVVSQILAAAGLILMAFLPELLPSPFIGIMISVVLYAIGSGLIEVLVSPIVEACPFEKKEGAMSLLHSFYSLGAVMVILGSTLFFFFFGIGNWKILAFIWALFPLYNIYNFMTCPIEKLNEGGEENGEMTLLKTPVFWLMILLMICAGASEATMAQWASAFTESALLVRKVVGDLLGPCLFAAFMAVSRLLYGKFSDRIDLRRAMLFCGIFCVICYLLAALSKLPLVGLFGCAFCGFFVGILWPGSLSISVKECPKGGTALFGFLALAGDLGGMISPMMAGTLSGLAGGNLKIGLLCATVFPLIFVVALLFLKKRRTA